MSTSVAMSGGYEAGELISSLPAAPLYPPLLWTALDILTGDIPSATADAELLNSVEQSSAGNSARTPGVGWGVSPSSAGAAKGSVRQFFYDQIFFDSTLIDFGTIGATETRQVSVWNSFMSPVEFSSFLRTLGDATGVTVSFSSASVGDLTGTDEIPMTLPSLAYLTISVQAEVLGPPEFLVRYLAGFTVNDLAESGVVGSDYHSMSVTGIRSQALIPFPNWENGMTEELEWLTNVVRVLTGLEHRSSLRAVGRRRLQFETLLTADNASRMRNLLQAWQNRAFMSPLWPYEIRLSANAAAAQNAVVMESVDAANCGIAAGVRVMLVSFATQEYEYMLVESVVVDSPLPGLTTFNMTLPLKFLWPAGSYCYPAGIAYVEGEAQISRLTADVESWTISLLFDPSTVPDFMPQEAAPITFTVVGSPDGSYEYLEQEPNWVEPIGSAHAFDALIQDNQTGGFKKSVTREFPSKSWQFAWLFKDRSLTRNFRAFLARRRGMWKSFIAPTWSTDFQITQNILNGQNYIICSPNGFDTTAFALLDRDFFVELVSGALKVRGKITSVDSTVAGQMRLNLDVAFPQDIPYNQVRTVRLMETYRLASDKVALHWINPRVATCHVDVTTVVNNRRVS